MAALTLTLETYRDKVLGGWQGKSVGITLGAPQRGRLTPGRENFYSPVPGQPAASVAMDFPLVWLATLQQAEPEIAPEDLAIAWLEHLDYPQDEFGYAALNLLRGLPPPASGAYANWFRHATGGVMRADLWAMLAPGAPQVAAAYAYHDAKLDHCEDGLWAAMFLAALGSAAFFLSDPLMLLTIGLAMIPRTCRTARAVKTALAAGQRGAAWLEARESIQHEVGGKNFSDAPQNMGFFTLGLLYGLNDFGRALCAAVNCGYDSEVVGGMLGAVLGIQRGSSGLPQDWTRPIGDLIVPGLELRDFEAPASLTEVAERTVALGQRIVEARCSDVALVEQAEASTPAVLEPAPPEPPSDADPGAPAMAEPAPPPTPAPAEPDTAPAALETNAAAPAPPQDAPAAPPVLPDAALSTPEETPAPPAAIAPAAPAAAPEPAGLVGLPTPPETADAPAAEADTPGGAPRLGAFAPQPVHPVESPSFAPATAPPYAGPGAAPPAPPVAPDLTGAIAWADSAQVKPLLVIPPNSMTSLAGPFEVLLDTGDSPAIGYGVAHTLSVSVLNRGADAFSGRIALLAPPGWQITAPPNLGQRQYVAAHTGTFRADFVLRVVEG
ncbi:MAG TPA: ADP-ribosylglycohydrolase family protein, partial [Chthonomonadaceae bacterium]|nr:ADP-ribosylglycohydrolase family protein [Chthonomonadaceae bacterium]